MYLTHISAVQICIKLTISRRPDIYKQVFVLFFYIYKKKIENRQTNFVTLSNIVTICVNNVFDRFVTGGEDVFQNKSFDVCGMVDQSEVVTGDSC